MIAVVNNCMIPTRLCDELMDGSDRIIARSSLRKIIISGQSAMPIGSEAELEHLDMGDLLAFFQQQLAED